MTPDWPSLLARYPGHPDALPERPWWRDTHTPVEPVPPIEYPPPPWPTMTAGIGGATSDRPRDPRYPRHPYVRTDGAVVYVDANASRLDVLAAYDRAHPLPVPEPACGQVWVWPEGEAMIGSVSAREGVCWCGSMLVKSGPFRGPPDAPWPPPGAVLVAGTHSPWADTTKEEP